jgi:hypothetical protein
MQIDTLPPVSNRETWLGDYTLIDQDTGETIDLDGADEITITVRDPQTLTAMLTGTLSGGEIAVVGDSTDGVFEWRFERSQMAALQAKTYEVGLVIEADDDEIQLLIGRLPVLDGIVS